MSETIKQPDAKAAAQVPGKEERLLMEARPVPSMVFRLLAALAHVEAERDALWTIISEIREPIKRCFIDRTMIFARFQNVAVRWYERVVGEGHPDTLRADRDRLASVLADAGRELENVKVLLRKANPYVKCHRHWGKDNRCTLCEIENDVMNFLSLPTPEGQIMTTTNQKIIDEIERLVKLYDELAANARPQSIGRALQLDCEMRECLYKHRNTIVAVLRALDALPRTWDGKPFVYGMDLFYVYRVNGQSWVGLAQPETHPKFCYSTREAALAALSHDNRQGAEGGKS